MIDAEASWVTDRPFRLGPEVWIENAVADALASVRHVAP